MTKRKAFTIIGIIGVLAILTAGVYSQDLKTIVKKHEKAIGAEKMKDFKNKYYRQQ